MAEDFYGPVRPALGWTLLAIGLVLVVVGWYAWVWWSTRTPRPPRRPRAERARRPEQHRAVALAEIDRLAAEHAAGRMGARELFQRLSPLVRRYVYETSGAPVHVRSLDDLRSESDPALTSTVAWMYPEEFAADAPGAVEEGLARARWYVTHAAVDERRGPA
jgi:Domain of unknown function (DUF4381)